MANGSWNSLVNDPGHFLGGLAPDIAAGALTAGAGTAASRGVRTGLRAADGDPLAATLRNLGVPTIRYQPHYAYAGAPGGVGGRFVTGNTTVGDLLDQLTLQSRADRGDSGSGGGGTSGQDSPGARAGSPDNRGGVGPGLPRDPDGLGDWGPVTESMSARAEVYQEQITGQPVNIGYVVDGTKFDGYANGEFIDAKGPGYNSFFRADGTPYEWWAVSRTGGPSMLRQARTQLRLAHGHPVVWYVAEAHAARGIEDWLTLNGIFDIEIRIQPPR
ncbi:hypothetical protein BJF80_03275 [Serinicoccus sp. CUA-874]|nr:hypothetical protein BJF80_03275 [Serinicoccus sp. CUA-874]